MANFQLRKTNDKLTLQMCFFSRLMLWRRFWDCLYKYVLLIHQELYFQEHLSKTDTK